MDESDWQDFWTEVSDGYWRYVTLANLANFHADSSPIDLPDGLRIATRSRSALSTTLGIPEDVLEVTIGQEWLDGLGGYGLFVVAHLDAVPKDGVAIPMSSTGNSHADVKRLLQALRLNGEGDVDTGALYMLQVARFSKYPGITRGGRPNVAPFGPEMMFVTERDGPAVSAIYHDLKAFEELRTNDIAALGVAISRFDASYGRAWHSSADRTIDDMIGLEALLGDSADLAYSISIRASGLRAASDSDRVRLFADLRDFYRARSDVVHGRKLSATREAVIAREPELRDVLRRLIRGYLHLHKAEAYPSDEKFRKTLDERLLDNAKRSALQADLDAGVTAPAGTSPGRITPHWADQEVSEATVIAGGTQLFDKRPRSQPLE